MSHSFFLATHPLPLIAMVRKQGSASLVPLGAYALAAVTWFSGSHRIYQEQLHQPEQYEQALKADGEPLGFELYSVGLNGEDDGAATRQKPPGMALVKPMTFSSSTFRSAKACPNTNLATARASMPCV